MPHPLRLSFTSKVCTAEAAARLIESGDCITVSGTVAWMLPQKLLQAIEVRFLSEGEPRDLTWFEPFPTGVPGIEPLSHAGLLKRVVGGWYTPHPALRDLITSEQVEAYLYPLGTLSFWCQAMAAGRDGFLTKVGLETYMDPRQCGGRLNSITREEYVSLADVGGETYLWFKKLPITAALIRGTTVDEEGNLSLEEEHVTMNVLYQALAAKRFGGKVIVQAKRLVRAGTIPTRMVAIPGALVDAIVIDESQPHDAMFEDMNWLKPSDRAVRPPARVLASPNREAWRKYVLEGELAEDLAPAVRPLSPDVLVARRAVLEMRDGDVLNIGQGLPARDILPVTIEEDIDRRMVLSIETGHLGGTVNGLGFRSDSTAILDTPGIFSLYGSGLIRAAFFSMLEFDAQGSVNLLRHGDTWVGPGGSMDIAQAADKVVFCGTFRAGGLQAEGRDGRLEIRQEGAYPRAVQQVQGICFNGPKMFREGKEVLYVTERAVFRLGEYGPELVEVAPGVDLEEDVLGRMEFRPVVSKDCRPMDARVFTPGVMGVREDWGKGAD